MLEHPHGPLGQPGHRPGGWAGPGTARQPAGSPGERARWRQRLSRFDGKASPYLFISPFFILFAVVGLFPLVYTAFVSLHDWHLIGGQGDFVGFDNFRTCSGQRNFWNALRNTFSIFLLSSGARR